MKVAKINPIPTHNHEIEIWNMNFFYSSSGFWKWKSFLFVGWQSIKAYLNREYGLLNTWCFIRHNGKVLNTSIKWVVSMDLRNFVNKKKDRYIALQCKIYWTPNSLKYVNSNLFYSFNINVFHTKRFNRLSQCYNSEWRRKKIKLNFCYFVLIYSSKHII